jgi:hypothetical protein
VVCWVVDVKNALFRRHAHTRSSRRCGETASTSTRGVTACASGRRHTDGRRARARTRIRREAGYRRTVGTTGADAVDFTQFRTST